jgi:hypothetical protein
MNASTTLEYPHVVLISPTSPELLRRAQTASGVEQFVPKRDLHHKRSLVAKRWLAVLDSHDTTLHRVSTRAESARLSIQYPFARKVGLFSSGP